MRLSTKGRYAVTAMLDLAVNAERGPITLAEISQCQGISLSYLEQLFARLRREGLVEGVRGPGGGYRLARPLHDISVADIVAAVDSRADAGADADNGPNGPCGDSGHGLTHALWNRLSEQIFDYLSGINLAEFLAQPAVRAVLESRERTETEPAGSGGTA